MSEIKIENAIKFMNMAKCEVEKGNSIKFGEATIQLFDIAISALKFKKYFDELYGQGLEVANWHQNGDLEPFDSFYESACEE